MNVGGWFLQHMITTFFNTDRMLVSLIYSEWLIFWVIFVKYKILLFNKFQLNPLVRELFSKKNALSN